MVSVYCLILGGQPRFFFGIGSVLIYCSIPSGTNEKGSSLRFLSVLLIDGAPVHVCFDLPGPFGHY